MYNNYIQVTRVNYKVETYLFKGHKKSTLPPFSVPMTIDLFISQIKCETGIWVMHIELSGGNFIGDSAHWELISWNESS